MKHFSAKTFYLPVAVVMATMISGALMFSSDNDKWKIIDLQQTNLNDRLFNGDTIEQIRKLKFPGRGDYSIFNVSNDTANYFAFAKDRYDESYFMFDYIEEGDILFSNAKEIQVIRDTQETNWVKQPVTWYSDENRMSVLFPGFFGLFAVAVIFIYNLSLWQTNKKKGSKELNTILTNKLTKFPFKTTPVVIVVIIWNILFILDFVNENGNSFYSQIAIIMVFLLTLLTLIINPLRKKVIKEDVESSEANKSLIILILITGAMILSRTLHNMV